MISLMSTGMRRSRYATSVGAALLLRLTVWLCLIYLLTVAAVSAQTSNPTPQPTPRRPLPKLSNGARGFNSKKSVDASSRLIAIGGGYGGGDDEEPLPKLKRRTAQGYYQWGLELYGAAQNEAIAAFEQAIKMNPNFVNAYWKLGEAYSEYNHLVDTDKSKYDDQECYRRAITAFKQVRRLQPGRAGVYNNLGVLYFDTGQYAKAIVAFQIGLRLKPKGGENSCSLMEDGAVSDAVIYVFIGDAYEQLDKNELALGLYQRALRLSGTRGLYLGDLNERLGLVYEKLGDVDKAIASYQEIDTRPGNYQVGLPNVSQRLGLLYATKGNYEQAIEYFDDAANDYTNELLKLDADAPDADTDKQVKDEWEQEVKSGKAGLTSALYNLGVAYLNSNRAKDAVVAFQYAIKADANNAEARFNLGFTYLTLGDKKAAVEQAQLLKEIDSELAKELEELIKR